MRLQDQARKKCVSLEMFATLELNLISLILEQDITRWFQWQILGGLEELPKSGMKNRRMLQNWPKVAVLGQFLFEI